jgi:hypothetical protein
MPWDRTKGAPLMGIFSWLRQKPSPDEGLLALAGILESNRTDVIVETARQLICDLDPNGCVQTLVGYNNMKHIYLPVSRALRERQVNAGVKNDDPCPDTIESYAKFIASSPIPNEPSRWRSYWFLYGLFLMKAEDIAKRETAYRDIFADIWIRLIESSRLTKTVLEHNVLWRNDEKHWWFDKNGNARISTARESIVYCANHVMPKWLCAHNRIIEFLKPMNICAFYDKSGFIDWEEPVTTRPPPGWGEPKAG